MWMSWNGLDITKVRAIISWSGRCLFELLSTYIKALLFNQMI
jgi:hypothetical protein